MRLTSPRRGRTRWLAASTTALSAIALAVALPASPASAAGGDRIAVGDSVMLGAKYPLKDRGFAIVDADESRQAGTAPGLLSKRGTGLPANVVVHLGTNGTFPIETCHDVVDTAGPHRSVYFLTIHAERSWVKSNNKMLRRCDGDYAADRVRIIDWDWAASRHPEWLYADGIHLRPEGAKAYARIVDLAVDSAQ